MRSGAAALSSAIDGTMRLLGWWRTELWGMVPERVRRLLAAKYGWKDRWIGMLADTSESLGLRISCEQA